MCEPYHSTVQFPDNDEFDNDDDLTGQSSRQAFVGKIGSFFKKIGRFLHVSKMGAGHTETLSSDKCNMAIHNFVFPAHIKWETNWAKRLVIFDGCYDVQPYLHPEAHIASQTYSETVSIGNLSVLRRFLAVSLEKTNSNRLQEYFNVFLNQFLNSAGRNVLQTKYTACFGRKKPRDLLRPQLIKFLLGFTRHREYLTTEWADDGKLWLPERKLITNM